MLGDVSSAHLTATPSCFPLHAVTPASFNKDNFYICIYTSIKHIVIGSDGGGGTKSPFSFLSLHAKSGKTFLATFVGEGVPQASRFLIRAEACQSNTSVYKHLKAVI